LARYAANAVQVQAERLHLLTARVVPHAFNADGKEAAPELARHCGGPMLYASIVAATSFIR
jgi:hypothetical protein